MIERLPRFFLVTPRLPEDHTFEKLLGQALALADVACVLVRTATPDESTIKKVVRGLAPVFAEREIALLISGPAHLVARVGADGLHLPQPGPELDEALDALRPAKIVGVGGVRSRDEAMTAGEAGIDYLMFGGPDDDEPHDVVLERVGWWAEIFNVPCVGYVDDPAHAIEIARAGAEFVALGDGLWNAPDPLAALREVVASLKTMPVCAS